MVEGVHGVIEMGDVTGTAEKGFFCQVVIGTGVMEADNTDFAGARDEVQRARLLRGDVVEPDATAAGIIELKEEIIIRVNQIIRIHGAFFLNGGKWTFEIDAAHDSSIFNGVVHKLARNPDHVQ